MFGFIGSLVTTIRIWWARWKSRKSVVSSVPASTITSPAVSYRGTVSESTESAEVPVSTVPKSFRLSGTVGAKGASVLIFQNNKQLAVAHTADGTFSVELPAGTYAVTPKLKGSLFHPEFILVDLSGDTEIKFSDPASVVDSRKYGNFPNDSVDIQGTLTYTVPIFYSRRAGAPIDCRVKRPVDCRKSPNIPQNSRL
jgi:hypothetical protein